MNYGEVMSSEPETSLRLNNKNLAPDQINKLLRATILDYSSKSAQQQGCAECKIGVVALHRNMQAPVDK